MTWNNDMSAAPDWEQVIIYEPESGRNDDVGEGYCVPLDDDGQYGWRWSIDNIPARPTHWMPLPTPPQEPDNAE